MYGMVNEGIRAFILDNYSEEIWLDVVRCAKIDVDKFESLLAYPDDITYKLVGAVSETLSVPAAAVLEQFGDFWIDFASETSVGELLSFHGGTFFERLQNLNEMHSRIKLSLPHLQPPSFRFEQSDSDVHTLYYESEREGLQPMVIGLLKGLARVSDEDIEVRVLQTKLDGAAEDIFEIEVKSKSDVRAA